MAMHVHAFGSAIFVISSSIAVSVAVQGPVLAEAAVCLEQPGRGALQGEHWYFHVDREKNRKCWHLGPAAAAPSYEIIPPPRVERTRPVGASSVEAAFSDLFNGIRRLFRRPMPHEAQAGEPRIIQSDATRPLTIEDIAQPQPELSELPEDRAEVRPIPTGSLTPAQRKTLYEEYLKWEELQRVGGAGAALPR
jgi:hypothetical protein